MNLKGKTVWITGASSGIGEQLAYVCAEKKAGHLILSARRESSLTGISDKCRKTGTRCTIIPFDLAIHHEVESAAQQLIDTAVVVDLLILNGGVSQRAISLETSDETARRIMEINFFSTVTLSRKLVPDMIKNGGGAIAVTSSITGKFGFPLRSVYAASKHALHGFFETLRLEHKDDNIGVTIVCPGRVRTDISVNALTGGGSAHGQMDEGQAKGISARKCAEQYIRAIERNKKEVLIGSGAELAMVYLKRLFPALFFKIASKIKAT